jgi:CubicO group peptidase (beta-lactamase class C family)
MREVKEVQRICKVPSICFGVLHEGEIIFTRGLGERRPGSNLPPNVDTLYHLGSVSKMLLSSAVGIAVDDGKLGWDTAVSKYIPGFNPIGDPEIGKRANLIDCLRHSTGLGNPQILIQAPRGHIIGLEEDFVEFMNEAPTSNALGQRFNSWWLYNNYSYALAAIALQNVYQQRYHKFLQERILKPLGMFRTAVTTSDFIHDDNVAPPTARLEDGKVVILNSEEFTSGEHTPTLAAMGIRSSVTDMLKWAIAVLAAEKAEAKAKENEIGGLPCPPDVPEGGSSAQYPSENPLKNISITRQSQWTRPAPDKYRNESAYGLGWCRMVMPSSMLGWTGWNYMTRYDDEKTNQNYILGTSSRPKLVIQHNGLNNGSSCAFYTFPETHSAIIVFSNGIQDGDAADFTAHIIIQALFDLQPHVDLLPLVKTEAAKRHNKFYHDILSDWKKHRDTDQPEAALTEYEGKYEALATTLNIARIDTSDGRRLSITWNGVLDTRRRLDFYNKDTYSFLPLPQDEWLAESMFDWDYYTAGLLEFRRDQEGKVNDLSWKYDKWEHPAIFKRKSGAN